MTTPTTTPPVDAGMHLAIPAIAQQLQSHLGEPWRVAMGHIHQDFGQLPIAIVRLAGAALPQGPQGRAVQLELRYQVSLIVSAEASDSFALLGRAVQATIAALHAWAPPAASLPRPVASLALQGVAEADLASAQIYGYELGFAQTMVAHGHP